MIKTHQSTEHWITAAAILQHKDEVHRRMGCHQAQYVTVYVCDTLFHKSFMESVLLFCIIALYKNLTLANKNRVGSLVKEASKISGGSQDQLIDLYNRQVVKKATSDHPLYTEFDLLPSG